ncbi:endolytic transglycosylase MltG [Neokomagataea tanensis]|uniref:Endolytic murein transglycosylase n=1 Tax=Neokomagataea tanensis TaxID=661191 RepID=A0A4Y6VBM0_9PROT|nr:endolytic transglycosylase MltG [Neokomagataea tanensis]
MPPGFGKKLAWLAVPFAFLASAVVGYGHYTDPGPAPEGHIVVVPRGGVGQVSASLQNAGVLAPTWSSGIFFKLAAVVTRQDGALHAAEFSFPARVSVAHILLILRHGHPVEHMLTFPEGLTVKRMELILQQAPFLKGDIPPLAEGQLFPETLALPLGTQRSTVVERLSHMMAERLQKIWAGRDVASLDGVIHTPQDLLVLASLIERETALPEERPMVARVFVNRLQLGMKLQTDPTVIYGVSDGMGTLDRPLEHDDLLAPGPYNTYLNAGLPPGAICSPSLSSLEAAAHPATGQALYFVANGRGGHRFAATLDEHNRNVQHLRDGN